MSMQQLTEHVHKDARGLYQDLKRFNADNECGVTPMPFFAAKARDEYGVYPEDSVLARREGHFLRKFGVQEHEAARQEKVRQYAFDSWVLEKFWADNKCPIHGPMTPTVEKAFTTTTLQGTFPIFFDQMLVEGILASPILDRLVAETVPTNSGIANHSELNETASDRSVVETSEGARTTQVSVSVRERQIQLKKFGYEALASYEALRRVRLPVFARTLARIGRQFQNLLTDFAIDVLVLGDGTSPSNAAATVAAAVAGAPTYADYLNLDMGQTMGYTQDLWIANKQAIIKLLSVPEFKDPLAGFRFQNAGTMPMPFGKEIVRWDTTGNTTAWPSTATNCKILAMNSQLGLIQYTEGGIITETDNIISSQWQKVVSTTWVAFGVMDPDSRIVGTGFA